MNRPTIQIRKQYFHSKKAVLEEIADDDLWPMTNDQGAFPAAEIHYHDQSVRIYVIAGELEVCGPSLGSMNKCPSGARIDIAAGALHTVSAQFPVISINAFPSAKSTSGLPQLFP